MNTLPKLYRESSDFEMKPKFLTDEEYIAAISAFVVVCSDVVIVNRDNKTVLLPFRKVKPAQGLWPIGGRRKAGETPTLCIQKAFKRETTLEIPEERFQFLTINEYLWEYRKEEPHNFGMHNLHHVYTLELSDDEVKTVASHLEPNEYDVEFGLKEYTRETLLENNAKEIIVDYYNKIFC